MNPNSNENEQHVDSRSWTPPEEVAATVLGAAEDPSGQVVLALKWQDTDELALVLAKEAYLVCPQSILKWYEGIIKWNDSESRLSNECISRFTSLDIAPSNPTGVSENMTNDVVQNGTPTEKVVEEIIGANKDCSGQLLFFLKYQGIEKGDLVKAKDAYLMCPRLILEFYEKSLTFHYND